MIKNFTLKGLCGDYLEYCQNFEKINQEIDIKNQALDLFNNFKEKVLSAYEEIDLVREAKSVPVAQAKSACRV
jgi:hypothetical protein